MFDGMGSDKYLLEFDFGLNFEGISGTTPGGKLYFGASTEASKDYLYMYVMMPTTFVDNVYENNNNITNPGDWGKNHSFGMLAASDALKGIKFKKTGETPEELIARAGKGVGYTQTITTDGKQSTNLDIRDYVISDAIVQVQTSLVYNLNTFALIDDINRVEKDEGTGVFSESLHNDAGWIKEVGYEFKLDASTVGFTKEAWLNQLDTSLLVAFSGAHASPSKVSLDNIDGALCFSDCPEPPGDNTSPTTVPTPAPLAMLCLGGLLLLRKRIMH